jgi:hypothetical protein
VHALCCHRHFIARRGTCLQNTSGTDTRFVSVLACFVGTALRVGCWLWFDLMLAKAHANPPLQGHCWPLECFEFPMMHCTGCALTTITSSSSLLQSTDVGIVGVCVCHCWLPIAM